MQQRDANPEGFFNDSVQVFANMEVPTEIRYSAGTLLFVAIKIKVLPSQPRTTPNTCGSRCRSPAGQLSRTWSSTP